MKFIFRNKYKSRMTRYFMIKKVLDRMNIQSSFKIIKWSTILSSKTYNKLLVFRINKLLPCQVIKSSHIGYH